MSTLRFLSSLTRFIVAMSAVCVTVVGVAQADVDAKVPPRLVVNSGHGRSVSAVAFSPDGMTLASSSSDRSIKLWEVASGREIRSLTGHDRGVTSVAFSADGKTLASGSEDESIKLWDVASGHELRSLNGHGDAVLSVSFSPDGKTLASGSIDKSIKLWEVATGRELRSLTGHGGWVWTVAFSPDGKTMASGSDDKTIKLWSIANGRELRSLTGHRDSIWSVAFSLDGKALASGSADNSIKLWEVASGRDLRTLTGHGKFVRSVAFSPDGNTLASGSADKSIRLWEIASGRELRSLTGHGDWVESVAFSPDGKALASGSNDKSIKLWDAVIGRELRSLTGRDNSVWSVAFSPDSKTLASGSDNKSIRLWNMAGERQLRTLNGHRDRVESVAFSPDSVTLASGSNDGSIKLWDVVSGRELRSLTGHGGFVGSVAFSADGKTLASGSTDTSIKLWDVINGREMRTLTGHKNNVRRLSFSPDDKTLASGSVDKTIKLWDTVSGRELRTLTGHGDWVLSIAFSPDGKTLASGSVDKTIKLWDTVSGRELRTLTGHGDWVLSIAFSPDGKTLASGSSDNSIKLWDAASARELSSLTGHGDSIWSVAFSPDGKMLASGSNDNSIKLWDVAKGALIATLYSFGTGDFLIVDADGRYDSSNTGQTPYLHWVVGMTPISLDQLKDRYYEPGLLAKIMGHNTDPLRPVPKLEDALLQLFPTITAQQSATQANRIDIALTDQGGGFGTVRMRVNGKEVVRDARQGLTLPGKTATLAVDIDPTLLLPGANTIEIQAWNRDEILRSLPVVLKLRGDEFRAKTPVAVASTAAATQPAEAPVLYAIVAGVSRYADPSMNLSYSGKDASDFAQALTLGGQRLFGASKVKLHLLTDQPPPGIAAHAPSKTAIQAAFAEVARAAKATDILVVYLSGHGAMSGGAEAEYHYLTREAQGTNLADPALRKLWGISSSEFTDWVKAIKTAKQVMVLDTCAAGGAVEKLAAPRVLSSNQIRALDRLHERSGFHILAGAAADKVSYEATRFGQGLLTYALLNGMKGAALRENEFVDVIKLFDYSAAQVPELAKGIGGIQRPQLYTVKGSSFDIGQLIEEDRRKLPAAASRPMLIRANFQDEQRFNDHLKLSQRFNQRLAQDNRSAARGSVGFVDADEFPDAWSVNGRYEVAVDTVRLKAKLFYGGQAKGDLLLNLPLDLGKQVEALYQSVSEAVK
jgi:WD40 repeat protein